MLVLAIDTATSGCSAALVDSGRVLARQSAQMPRGQSEALMPMVLAVMADAGRSLEDVDIFGVTAGPGGFTGLRIGLAAARGMALAADKPCIGVTTFDALAHAISVDQANGRLILSIVESKRADAFLQLYTPDHAVLGESVTLTPENLSPWLDENAANAKGLVATGDAAAKFAAQLREWGKTHSCPVEIIDGPGLPDAVVIARLAAEIFTREGAAAITSHPARPVYLRAPDVSMPKNKTKRVSG